VSPPANLLRQIVENRRSRVELEAGPTSRPHSESRNGNDRPISNRFSKSLDRHRGRAVIAEIKMGSPRIGSLHGRLDPLRQARLYADNGAAAVSVVVEPDFFFGSYELLAACRESSGLPILAKDFVVHPVQLDWARQAGADAVLLIAALFSDSELQRFAGYTRSLGMVPLIETHDASDVGRLSGSSWEVVGINNRDLATFAVNLERSIRLLPRLPGEALKVAESGIKHAADVERLARAGFDAFLVGEALLLADDPGAKLQELMARP
jgi:indole-3-glycerol phosphate synthase